MAFTRWRVAVFVDGAFWHGHPSKWRPDQFRGYWDEKIRRNMARDRAQDETLSVAGWRVVRVWEFEVEQHPVEVVARVRRAVEEARRTNDRR